MRIDEATSQTEAAKWRIVCRDSYRELPGHIVFADDDTGEVVMEEDAWDRVLDTDGNPVKDSSGNILFRARRTQYTFPPGIMRIIRR